MGDLSLTQLLLLNNLVYLEGVFDHGNESVRQIIRELTDFEYKGLMKSRCKYDKFIGTDEEWPACMSKEQWIEVLEAIGNDPKLMSLKIENIKVQESTYIDSDNVLHKLGGMRVACFVDKKSNTATVVFRGTHGPCGWHDNGTCGYLPDTEQQIASLEYVEALPEYKYIIATGHSSGGNKSQYVTIMSDRIKRGISFDGQGFSKEFIRKHSKEIAINAHKINAISATNDFVSCLFNSIAVHEKYISTPGMGKDFHHYHCPNALLRFIKDKKGNITAVMRESGEQTPLSKLVNRFTIYLNENVEYVRRREFIDGLVGKYFEGREAAESIEEQDKAIEILKEIGFEFAKNELTLKEIKEVLSQDELHDLGFAMIHDKFGPVAELGAALFLTMISPKLFYDELSNSAIVKYFKGNPQPENLLQKQTF